MNRDSIILRKLGLTEEDVRDSQKLFSQIPPPPLLQGKSHCSKEERLLGYTKLRLRRAKALRVLGASEEDVDIENTKTLGALGIGGRRRSFYIENNHLARPRRMTADHSNLRPRTKRSRLLSKSYSGLVASGKYRKKSLRRRSTGDILILQRATREVEKLKRHNEDVCAEINRLKQRLIELEKEFGSKLA